MLAVDTDGEDVSVLGCCSVNDMADLPNAVLVFDITPLIHLRVWYKFRKGKIKMDIESA
jgi:hypothetical protein